ncbi:MAG TPA: TerD family protein [Fibrobacteria bacterium]|nr:TerD family protein [Fibrobacteria bacterium]HOX52547.1 TerD family protein [Fibrobacteria bacterium]
MAISLTKGQNTSLTKDRPGLKSVRVGLGWEVRSTAGDAFDLDASAFLLAQSGKVRGEQDFIFYNQPASTCGSVQYMGDNRTGDGDGDDEVIEVHFDKVPSDVVRIVVAVTIHEAAQRRQNFGQVRNAFIRVLDIAGGQELVRFDLSEDYSTETSMLFGELYFHNGQEWKFRALGQGYPGGLEQVALSFGIALS